MLRLFGEQEANERAFEALTRFLDLLDETPRARTTRPALDPLALSFQLKLLWLSGYLPHLTSCAECGATTRRSSATRRAPAARVCRACASHGALGAQRRTGVRGIEALLGSPLADAQRAGLGERARRDALARRHLVVRVPRRLPAAHAQRVARHMSSQISSTTHYLN